MAVAAPDPVALRAEYLGALADADVVAARGVIDAALEGGLPVRDIYLALLAPALVEVGERWERGELSVAQEHLATATTEAVIAGLAAGLHDDAAPGAGRRAIVSCTEGELHAVGARFVADFLEGDGWEVMVLGASAPGHDVVRLAAETRPDFVALSTTLASNLGRVAETFNALRALDPRPVIGAGGGAYSGDEARALALGADVFASDPEGLRARLRTLFGAS